MPECEDCFPLLFPENSVAVDLYMLCCNQVIVSGMGDLIDLDYKAVIGVMEMEGIEDKKLQSRYMKQIKRIFQIAKEKFEERKEKENNSR